MVIYSIHNKTISCNWPWVVPFFKFQTNLRKELEKCKHPNSRKTKALSKKARRQNNKHKQRLGHAIKSNIMGEKLTWFLEHMEEGRKHPLTPQEFEELIQQYLKRFDEELEQIALKQSISKHRANQHVAREDVIKITLEKETNEYKAGGMGKESGETFATVNRFLSKGSNCRRLPKDCFGCLRDPSIVYRRNS